MILLVELFNSCLPKQKCRPFPLHINNWHCLNIQCRIPDLYSCV
jgi:hypothetical protein